MEGECRLTEPLIECVPNLSEGRDRGRIEELVSAVAGTPGILVLNQTSDWDHHRTVITFAGRPSALIEAAVRLVSQAARSIDLTRHHGVHPRVGALDVLPFVPLGRATMDDCVALAHRTGKRLVEELGMPVYFYGAAALRPDRVALENVRRGQFEGLREAVLVDETRAPDLGGPAFHPTAGAVIVGARKILIAFNINLKTTDARIAQTIARQVRASGGGFPAVKALGLPLMSRGLVQVSMNLTDYELTPLHVVYEEVARLAAAQRVEIESSELIGLLPRRVMELATGHFLKLPNFGSRQVIEEQLRVQSFSTIDLPGAFFAEEKVC